MKLLINKKLFNFKKINNYTLSISLDNDVDVIFFENWEDKKTTIKLKKNILKDIDIYNNFNLKCGTIKNCFPIVSLNDNDIKEVKIIFDFMQIIS